MDAVRLKLGSWKIGQAAKLLALCSTMAQCFDLEERPSLDELVSLANRIEWRIRRLTEASTAETAEGPQVRSCPAAGATDTGSNAPAGGKIEEAGVRTTLSERVQGLIQANDPWEGSGVGPTRWSLPFYGGHIIRKIEVLGFCSGSSTCFWGCTVYGHQWWTPQVILCDCLHILLFPSEQEEFAMFGALCDLLLPLQLGWSSSWASRL